MLDVNAQAYQDILDAVLKCATNCFFRGKQREGAITAIGEEYRECLEVITKSLEVKVGKNAK